jgi:DNA invertase Pin-like site-specific DNA recombinase
LKDNPRGFVVAGKSVRKQPFVKGSKPVGNGLLLGYARVSKGDKQTNALQAMERVAEAGAGFRSLTENIDTTTPAGRMMMQMVGSFAEFERAMIRERTSAGLAAARAEGRVGGRRRKLDTAKRREIAESVITGRKSGADMARLYNISQPTVSRIVAAHRTSPA